MSKSSEVRSQCMCQDNAFQVTSGKDVIAKGRCIRDRRFAGGWSADVWRWDHWIGRSFHWYLRQKFPYDFKLLLNLAINHIVNSTVETFVKKTYSGKRTVICDWNFSPRCIFIGFLRTCKVLKITIWSSCNVDTSSFHLLVRMSDVLLNSKILWIYFYHRRWSCFRSRTYTHRRWQRYETI